MLSTSRYIHLSRLSPGPMVTPVDCIRLRVRILQRTYLAEHQEEHSIGHAGGVVCLSVVHRYPWQLREKSAPLILWQWRGTGSEGEGCLVFQAVQFKGFFRRMSYPAAVERFLPKLHLSSDQVRFVVSFSSSALMSWSWSSCALLFSSPLLFWWGDDVRLKWGVRWWAGEEGSGFMYIIPSHFFLLCKPQLIPPDFSPRSHFRVLYTSTCNLTLLFKD